MFEHVTHEDILERMLARVPDNMDKREGSLIWDTHSPTAIELKILYMELDRIIQESYGDTASREFLILLCRERGIQPYQATKAILKGVFTPAAVEVSGQRFNIGDINYIVRDRIADGEYQVECETAGVIGNQYLGSMVPIGYIDGLQTAELAKLLIPGEDEEGTEELRKRYLSSFDAKAFGGNLRDYLEKVNALPGVGSTKVTRVWNGDIRPAEMIPSDTIKAWYENNIGLLPEEVSAWLKVVYMAAAERKLTVGGTVRLTIIGSDFNVASDTLIRFVQEAIDPDEMAGEGYGLAPIGHVVLVEGAAPISIQVKAEVTFAEGYGWGNLQGAIDTAISAYLLELRKAWADVQYLVVRVSQIETRILSVTGIVDIRHTSINEVEDNLTLGAYEIPVYGGAWDAGNTRN